MSSVTQGSTSTEGLENCPFIELGCPFTYYEAFKMAVLLPLLPLRLVVGGLALVIIAVINSLAAWNWPPEKALTPWRRRIVLLSKELVLITLWCLGFRIRVSGREYIKLAERLGAVAIFNHVSWVDAFVLVWLMAPSGVSKESNSRIPVISRAVRALQTVYIPYSKLSKRDIGAGTAGAAEVAAAPARPPTTSGHHSTAAMIETLGDITTGSSCSSHGNGQPAASPMCNVANKRNDGNDIHGGSCGSSACCSGGVGVSAVSKGSSSTDGDSSGSRTGTCSEIAPFTDCLQAASVTAATTNNNNNNKATTTAAVTTTAANNANIAAISTTPPPRQPTATSGAHCRQEVLAARVTEVLLHRVSDPSYCQPGGFPILAMAPEGTTASGRGLLEFRTGAFILRRPLLPICFRYRWRGLNPAWTMGDERWHFLRLVSQFRNDLEVDILPPYKPSEDERRNPRLFATHVRRQMAAVLEIPLLDVSHDDYLALRRRAVGVSWDGRRITLPGGGGGGATGDGQR